MVDGHLEKDQVHLLRLEVLVVLRDLGVKEALQPRPLRDLFVRPVRQVRIQNKGEGDLVALIVVQKELLPLVSLVELDLEQIDEEVLEVGDIFGGAEPICEDSQALVRPEPEEDLLVWDLGWLGHEESLKDFRDVS